MGNCCFKTPQDPNKPVGIPQAPTGVNDIKFSRPRKPPRQPHQEVNLSIVSNTRRRVDETVSRRGKTSKPVGEISLVSFDKRKGFNEKQISTKPLGERNFPVSSDPHREKLKKDGVFHGNEPHNFCYNVLKVATEKFCERNRIGRGGFGDVYKGWIDLSTMAAAKPGAGIPVAVKTLRKEGPQGCEEWLNEKNFLSRLKHPNVVKLIGYCSKGEHRILVYEYMTKGSLEARLLRKCDTELNWSRRIRIAVESAKGLEYLHSARTPVIHRDLKSSNILLDNGFRAKLSDFGLAKFGPQGDETHISTRVLGTKGYFAPEYITTGHLTLRTDVYSFGVVLLEILSGSAAMKRHSDGVEGDLTEWARPYLNNRLEIYRVIDKKLRRNLKMEEAYEFAGIIRNCLNSEPKHRPNMTEVVHALEKLERKVSDGGQ